MYRLTVSANGFNKVVIVTSTLFSDGASSFHTADHSGGFFLCEQEISMLKFPNREDSSLQLDSRIH